MFSNLFDIFFYKCFFPTKLHKCVRWKGQQHEIFHLLRLNKKHIQLPSHILDNFHMCRDVQILKQLFREPTFSLKLKGLLCEKLCKKYYNLELQFFLLVYFQNFEYRLYVIHQHVSNDYGYFSLTNLWECQIPKNHGIVQRTTKN